MAATRYLRPQHRYWRSFIDASLKEDAIELFGEDMHARGPDGLGPLHCAAIEGRVRSHRDPLE